MPNPCSVPSPCSVLSGTFTHAAMCSGAQRSALSPTCYSPASLIRIQSVLPAMPNLWPCNIECGALQCRVCCPAMLSMAPGYAECVDLPYRVCCHAMSKVWRIAMLIVWPSSAGWVVCCPAMPSVALQCRVYSPAMPQMGPDVMPSVILNARCDMYPSD